MPPPTVFIQDSPEHPDRASAPGRWLELVGLERTWSGRRRGDVMPALEAAEAWAESGGWSAGFLTYEAAPAMDPALAARRPPGEGLPLFWWGAFREARPVPDLPPAPAADNRLPWRPALDEKKHAQAVERIRRHIAAGDTYQVNLTFPLTASLDPGIDPLDLLGALSNAQQARYGAYFDLGDQVIVSASPELFFRLDGDRLVTRPMKGTSRRGRWPAEDAERLQELHSEKNRAENLMILDMMRNDLGRVAEPGTVRVTKLFAAETYPTVHQLVSEVTARTRASRAEILRALFPCASITGAPKIRATELIRDLESAPRGLYTGTLGYFGPDRTAQLNVAIRTVVLDRARETASYGTGGGIVWDSEPADEYRECRSKALVLTRTEPPFDLLETILWRPKSGYFLLERHLDRLLASARYFDRPADATRIREALDRRARELAGGRHKVRLLVDADGKVTIEALPLPCSGRRAWTLALDDRPVDSRDVFLFHKTTRREVYERARARRPDADEVALWNADGELTEGTIGNLVLRFGRRFLTPPVSAGLLPGTYRAALLERGRLEEAPLPRTALREADAVFLVSSVRGWVRLSIPDAPPRPRGSEIEEPARAPNPTPAFVSER